MRSMTSLILVGFLVATASAVAPPNQPPPGDNGIVTLGEYFDLLVSGNLESARSLWMPAALERSSRFGIEYEGIPLKVDCASPVVRDVKKMRDYLQPPVKQVTGLSDDLNRLLYSQLVDNQVVEYAYYTYFDGTYYWLTYPQDFYGRDWPVQETKYFRIHVDPAAPKQLNPVVLESADRWIEAISDTLKLTKSQVELMAAQKIEYFYCSSDSLVHEITGLRVKGTYDMASDDIISAFFPHYHELVHLLVNMKLHSLPMYTQPLVQEGLAVYYGGRWGKAPSALLDLGGFLYREKIVDLDSLLTARDFDRNSSSDIAYPVAGLMAGFLRERLGNDFWSLYRALSGNYKTVYDMTRAQVQDTLVKFAGVPDWAALLADFEKYIASVLQQRVPLVPGQVASGRELCAGPTYRVVDDGDWIGVEFSRPSGTPVTGNLMFGLDQRLVGGGSELYLSQYDGRVPYEGYRFGLRYDQNEVGLYDYANDLLLAKYIWGISPSPEYYDEAANRVTLKIRSDLIDKTLLNPSDVKHLEF